METLYELKEGIQNEVISRLQTKKDRSDKDEIYEIIEEVIDSYIPIYTEDILAMAQADFRLACSKPQHVGYLDHFSAIELISRNIYEYLHEETMDRYHKL